MVTRRLLSATYEDDGSILRSRGEGKHLRKYKSSRDIRLDPCRRDTSSHLRTTEQGGLTTRTPRPSHV